jgi:hypothetical protein
MLAASTQAAALHGGPVHGWSGFGRLRSEGQARQRDVWRRQAGSDTAGMARQGSARCGSTRHCWRGWLGSASKGLAGMAWLGVAEQGMNRQERDGETRKRVAQLVWHGMEALCAEWSRWQGAAGMATRGVPRTGADGWHGMTRRGLPRRFLEWPCRHVAAPHVGARLARLRMARIGEASPVIAR